LLVRDDLSAILIESKIKKAKFLETVANELSLSGRIQIINRQFEEAEQGPFSIVTCRALDKFTEKLPRLLKWSKKRKLLLFGGNNLREALQKEYQQFKEKLMPLSEQRFLYILERP
jgi:16S rRNA G527 N7-methylase RsmG